MLGPESNAFNVRGIVSSADVFYIVLTPILVVAFALADGVQNLVEGVAAAAAITIDIIVGFSQDCLSFYVVRSHRHSRSGFILGTRDRENWCNACPPS